MPKKIQKKTKNIPQTEKTKYLGDYVISLSKFKQLSEHLRKFKTKEFQQLNERQKNEKINRTLFDLINQTPAPCFLLAAVTDYIEQVSALNIFDSYTFLHFELWLNQFSSLTPEQNYEIRAKIVGKRIPREAYQVLFPVGMGKTYPGSHFVTAHGSPDLDTTISSFWGWVDAFAARVAEGLHLWNIPGEVPVSQIEIKLLFNRIFGEGVFNILTKNRTALSVSGIELMTQKGLVRKQTNEPSLMDQNAVILVDKEGYYLGDWRDFDVEGVRSVILQLNHCLRWFENHLHVQLISLFAKDKLSLKDLPALIKTIFSMKFSDSQPAKEFTENQQTQLNDYLAKVLNIKHGLDSTLEEFAQGMTRLSVGDFQKFVTLVKSLPQSSLFDKKGLLIEDRPHLFNYLEKIIRALDDAIQGVSNFVEKLGVALNIKTHVFGYAPQYVSPRADVDEIKSKMGNHPYLSVVSANREGKLIPWGIIHSQDLYKNILGTVSLRDFCNREETKIPPFLEVISVMDHHKSSLHTSAAPLVLIADAQSTNVLCAEMAFKINDSFGTGGMNKKQIAEQTATVGKNLSLPSHKKLMQRLLQKQLVLDEQHQYYIHPHREFLEYLHFLYGIFDDTDLLTKVSQRDVECVVHLVNRLKSIMLQQEVEVISLDDIPRDAHFVQRAAKKVLQNLDVYSLYRKIYLSKEEAVEENMLLCAKQLPSYLFVDTKEQNGCARVGQTKMFASNYPTFSKHAKALRKSWLAQALDFFKDRSEIDLHLQMISTVAGAEDLFAGTEGEFDHQDELWIWIPFTEQSIEHLKGFLNAFRLSPQMNQPLSAEFYGERAKDYEQIFNESFVPRLKKELMSKEALSVAVLKYKAGSINSRKAMISPYLPKPN
jgi:hypothetical protein